jgi:hypothetical protein
MFAEQVSDVIPKIKGYTGINTLVAHYGKLSFFGDDKKKDAVPLPGMVHIQAEEGPLGDVEHWPIQLLLEVDPDFARRLGLGLPDGQDDRLFLFFR